MSVQAKQLLIQFQWHKPRLNLNFKGSLVEPFLLGQCLRIINNGDDYDNTFLIACVGVDRLDTIDVGLALPA